MIGTPESDVIAGVTLAASTHGIAVEELSRRELIERFPQHQNLDPHDVGIWDPESGAVRPEASIVAAVAAAEQAGATVYGRTAVLDLASDSDGVLIRTSARSFRVGRVIIATGAWLSKFLPGQPLKPLRTPMTWFGPRVSADEFTLERFPIFIRAVTNGQRLWGHGAVFGHGVKIGPQDDPNYHLVDPDRIDRGISEVDWRHVGALIEDYVPGLNPRPTRTTTCMITLSPDMQFQLGPLRNEPRLIVAGGDSGHAFKHATGLGEYLAQLTVGEEPFVDLSFTDPNRF
jgi:sarcosine oxidase